MSKWVKSLKPYSFRFFVPIAAMEALSYLYRFLEEAAERFARERGAPICVEGCGLCCMHNTPIVTEPEANYVTSVGWLSLDEGTRKKIVENIERWHKPDKVAEVFNSNVRDARIGDDLPEPLHSKRLFDYTRASRAQCPFFDGDTKRCMIHDFRPIVCRNYSLAKAPEWFCKRPLVKNETNERRQFLSPLHPFGVELREAVRGWWQRCRDSGATDRVGWLPNLVARMEFPQKLQQWIDEGKTPLMRMMIARGGLPYPVGEEDAIGKQRAIVESELVRDYEEQGYTTVSSVSHKERESAK